MKAGFTKHNYLAKDPKIILVANYIALNAIINFGFSLKKGSLPRRQVNDIGFWRIKRKETIKAK